MSFPPQTRLGVRKQVREARADALVAAVKAWLEENKDLNVEEDMLSPGLTSKHQLDTLRNKLLEILP